MDIPYHELTDGARLYDENIDVMLLERSNPTVYGSSIAVWLIDNEKVLVWFREIGFFGHIRIYSIEGAIDAVLSICMGPYLVGRVSEGWNNLMIKHNKKPLECN